MLGSREVSVNEIWPRVPWAPSHSYHVMPPRITRNSYRPRASDRTMVDFESPFALSLSQTRPRPLTRLRRLIRMGTRQTSPGKPHYRGLDLEKTSRLRSRQKFFLDIPFDRTHQGSMHYERTPRFTRLKLSVASGCTPDSEWLTSATKNARRAGPGRWQFYLGGK